MQQFVYEPLYQARGWLDDSGISLWSWVDRDLTDPFLAPAVFVNVNNFFSPVITTVIFPTLFVNTNSFPRPRVFVVTRPTQVLKNEVRRVRFLRR